MHLGRLGVLVGFAGVVSGSLWDLRGDARGAKLGTENVFRRNLVIKIIEIAASTISFSRKAASIMASGLSTDSFYIFKNWFFGVGGSGRRPFESADPEGRGGPASGATMKTPWREGSRRELRKHPGLGGGAGGSPRTQLGSTFVHRREGIGPLACPACVPSPEVMLGSFFGPPGDLLGPFSALREPWLALREACSTIFFGFWSNFQNTKRRHSITER